jgi:hypothetical protein
VSFGSLDLLEASMLHVRSRLLRGQLSTIAWEDALRKTSGLRNLRYQAFDAETDPKDLAEAREWRQSFRPASVPKGSTTYSRSSGPGGQHVNKYVLSSLIQSRGIYLIHL